MYCRPEKLLFHVALLHIMLMGLLSAQVNIQSSTQPTSSEKSQSASLTLVGTVGQSSPVGTVTSGQYVIKTGFLNYLEETLGDITAPTAPSGLTVTPAGWTSVNDFSVSWNNPASDAKIGGAWYKIGPQPLNNNDGTWTSGDIESISNILVAGPGLNDIYVWLQDTLGNKMYTNAAQGQIRFDNVAPEITHTPVLSQTVNQAVTISATGSDEHSQLQSLMLYYRKTGDISRIDSANIMTGPKDIPGTVHGDRGCEYVIYARDNAGNKSRSPASGYYSVQAEFYAGLTQPLALHAGATANDYRIVSLPIVPDNKTPKAVFEDDLGSYDPEKWRLFDVSNGQLREYSAISEQSLVQPGKAFLLITNLPDRKITSGTGKSASVAASSQLSLGSGWALLGNPFNFDIPLDSLRVNGNIPELWELTSEGWRNTPTHLRAWQGLAIRLTSAGTLRIGVAEGTGFSKSVSDQFSGENWGMQISARAQSGMDLDNYLGVYSDDTGTERHVWHEPPQLENALSLSIDTEDMVLAKPLDDPEEKLSSLIQEQSPDGNFWDLDLRGGKTGEIVTLGFEQFGNIPDNFSAFLIDKKMNLAHNLEFLGWKYETKVRAGESGRFRVVVGDMNYVQNNSDGVAVMPVAYDLRQNFPNPFNPRTSIVFTIPVNESVRLEIFDILGQRVATLINDQMLDAGYYQVDWEGRNTAGVPVASGIYIYRLRAGEFVKMKKAILAR